MSDRYAVIGNPVAHSRSPFIHAHFARQTGQALTYETLLAPVDGFAAAVDAFRVQGGRGMNVTLPFKLQAHAYATRLSERARAAGAVNTMRFESNEVYGDNTDGIGLINDLTGRLACPLQDSRVLLLGAGGAARGVLLPLLQAGCRGILITNRTASRAIDLATGARDPRVTGAGFEVLDGSVEAFDLVLNATATGLGNEAPPVPTHLLAHARLAYDFVYAARPTTFMRQAGAAGCACVSDGLGMLVEQAAEAFVLWRGVRPFTHEVYGLLRAQLDASR